MEQYISYNQEDYPVKIGYYALKHTAREVKKTTGEELAIEDILSSSIEVLEPLLFYSLQMGAKVTKTEFAFVREDMEFVLDECMQEFMTIIPTFFPNADDMGKQKAQTAPVKPKKEEIKK